MSTKDPLSRAREKRRAEVRKLRDLLSRSPEHAEMLSGPHLDALARIDREHTRECGCPLATPYLPGTQEIEFGLHVVTCARCHKTIRL